MSPACNPLTNLCTKTHAPVKTPSQRFSQGDKSCDEEILPEVSGYCLCEGNITTARCGGGWAAAGRRPGGGRAAAAASSVWLRRAAVEEGASSKGRVSSSQSHHNSPTPLLPTPPHGCARQGDLRTKAVHLPPKVRRTGLQPDRRARAADPDHLPLRRCVLRLSACRI
jgi:hypothetical protein